MAYNPSSTYRLPRGILTQRQVAALWGISQTRVKQIERRALEKLLRGVQVELREFRDG